MYSQQCIHEFFYVVLLCFVDGRATKHRKEQLPIVLYVMFNTSIIRG